MHECDVTSNKLCMQPSAQENMKTKVKTENPRGGKDSSAR